MILEGTKMR